MDPALASADTFDDVVAAATTGVAFYDQFLPRPDGLIDVHSVPGAILTAALTLEQPVLASLVGWAMPRPRREFLLASYIASHVFLRYIDVVDRAPLFQRLRERIGPPVPNIRPFTALVDGYADLSPVAACYHNGFLDALAVLGTRDQKLAWAAGSDPDNLLWNEGRYVERIHNWVCGILDMQRVLALAALEALQGLGTPEHKIVGTLITQVPEVADEFFAKVLMAPTTGPSALPDPMDALLYV